MGQRECADQTWHFFTISIVNSRRGSDGSGDGTTFTCFGMLSHLKYMALIGHNIVLDLKARWWPTSCILSIVFNIDLHKH